LEANNSWKERLFHVKNIDELKNLQEKAQKVKGRCCPFCARTFGENKNNYKHIREQRCKVIEAKLESFKPPASTQKELTQ
jgi:hypothetical protein